jgi:hypothetical protein
MSDDVPDKRRNCDADVPLKYATERLTLHEIGHDLLHAFMHVDRSALSLVRMLLSRPGTVALNYVQGKRKSFCLYLEHARFFRHSGNLAVVLWLRNVPVPATDTSLTDVRDHSDILR